MSARFTPDWFLDMKKTLEGENPGKA